LIHTANIVLSNVLWNNIIFNCLSDTLERIQEIAEGCCLSRFLLLLSNAGKVEEEEDGEEIENNVSADLEMRGKGTYTQKIAKFLHR